jgi:hypothetical protein
MAFCRQAARASHRLILPLRLSKTASTSPRRCFRCGVITASRPSESSPVWGCIFQQQRACVRFGGHEKIASHAAARITLAAKIAAVCPKFAYQRSGAVTSRTNGAITCKTARKAFMRLSLLNRNRLSAGHFDEHSLLRLKKQKLSAKTHFLSQLDFAEILSNLVIPPSPQFQIRIGIPFKPKLLSLKRVVT